jgi:hypothetical protein
MSRIIGGEFPINPCLINPKAYFQHEKDEYLYANGRSAFYYILMNINNNYPAIDTILLPEYLCYSIIEVIKKTNFKYIFYAINEILMPDVINLFELNAENSCLLLINYFGIINIEPIIAKLKKTVPQMCIILDNVQALFEMRKKTMANYSFTSFRKWLAVPDGAIVKTNEKGMIFPNQTNAFCQWKFAASILKEYNEFPEIDDAVYLDLFSKGEELLKTNYNYKCSEISLSILNQLNFTDIIFIRKKNALYLLKEIDSRYLIIKDKSA